MLGAGIDALVKERSCFPAGSEVVVPSGQHPPPPGGDIFYGFSPNGPPPRCVVRGGRFAHDDALRVSLGSRKAYGYTTTT